MENEVIVLNKMITMTKNTIRTGLAVLALLMIIGFVTTLNPPSFEGYIGYVVINGELVPEGTLITVEVTGTGEIVAGTTVGENGRFALTIEIVDPIDDGDGKANRGDPLTWRIYGLECTTPLPGADIAESGKINEDYTIGIGEIPLIIVDYTPKDTTISINEGGEIDFTAGIAHNPESVLTYNWMVNRVTKSTSSSYTYKAEMGEGGTKIVTLEVSDGISIDTQSWTVEVNQFPRVSFTHLPDSPTTSDVIQFTDTSTDDGSIVSWLWIFGDGSTSTDQNPTHQYESGGIYGVVLIATDDDNVDDYRIEEIEVVCPPEFERVDLNDDHEVDMGDLFAITKSGYWGCYPDCGPGYEEFDLNEDGAVDMGDLFAVTKSGYWGEECYP